MSIKYREQGVKYTNQHIKKYDKDKIKFKRNGKMVNMYDYIQEQNVDLNIYEVLEKSGTIESMIKKNIQEIYGDFTQANSLRNICDRKVAVNEIFETLPLDVRRKFDNDLSKFIENGENYFTEILQQQQAQEQARIKQETPQGGQDVQK